MAVTPITMRTSINADLRSSLQAFAMPCARDWFHLQQRPWLEERLLRYLIFVFCFVYLQTHTCIILIAHQVWLQFKRHVHVVPQLFNKIARHFSADSVPKMDKENMRAIKKSHYLRRTRFIRDFPQATGFLMIQLGISRYMGTPPSFSAMFSKGDNFCDSLFAYLEDEVFPKLGLLLKERIFSYGSKFCPLLDDSNLWEATMKLAGLLPLKCTHVPT